MFIKPGDKVFIIENVSDPCPDGRCHGDDDMNIVATKGSLGVIVSSIEFREYLFRVNENDITRNPAEKEHLQRYTSQLRPNRKGRFPVRLSKVAPVDVEIKIFVSDQEKYLEVGKIYLMYSDSFQVISEEEYAKLLMKSEMP